MEKIILIGGGGHCKSIIDTLKSNEQYEIVGILDTEDKVGNYILGCKIIGTDSLACMMFKSGVENAVISLGSIGDTKIRRKIAIKMKKIGFNFPSIIDNTAIISEYSNIGEGTFIGKGAIINASSNIGRFCIINTGSVVEHDCIIEDFVHISPKATLCGGVEIGEDSHVGANSTIIQNTKVEKKVMIGAAAVVLEDVKSNSMVVGNPGRTRNV